METNENLSYLKIASAEGSNKRYGNACCIWLTWII